MTTNSAHDDIDIFYEVNSESEMEPINDKNAETVLNLLQIMKAAEKEGSAHVTKQSIEFKNNTSDTTLHFELNQIDEIGWLATQLANGAEKLDNQDIGLSITDRNAIEKGDFSIEFSLEQSPKSYTLDELLHQMDVFSVGRPSTYSSTLKSLEDDSELIDFNEMTADVKLTEKGLVVALILRELAGKLGDANYSTTLNAMFTEIEKGELSPITPILKVYEDIFGHEARKEVESITWSNIDDLYRQKYKKYKKTGGAIGKQGEEIEVL